jgi:hypothetical protein
VKKADDVPKSVNILKAVKEVIKKDILPYSEGPSHLASIKPVTKLKPLRIILPITLEKNLLFVPSTFCIVSIEF